MTDDLVKRWDEYAESSGVLSQLGMGKIIGQQMRDRIEALTAERDRLRGADVTQSCIICTGSGRVKVGVSFPPKSTIAVKVEYDPCPGCTPPPHTYHAKLVAKRLQEMRAALKGESHE